MVQEIADDIGVSQPYLYRLFGTKRALFLACLDELESRICGSFLEAPGVPASAPLDVLGARFRSVVADGVLGGMWIQATAAAQYDPEVADRLRRVLTTVVRAVSATGEYTDADVGEFAAHGALVMFLQPLGVDLSAGTDAAIAGLRASTGHGSTGAPS